MEAFEDTRSKPQVCSSGQRALSLFRKQNPDVVFVNPGILNPPLAAALKTLQASRPDFRLFGTGPPSEKSGGFLFDECFDALPSLSDFQKLLSRHLPVPDPLRLLVVDNEPEIGEVYRDYFDHRTQPAFLVELARDGVEGEERIKKNPPDVLILDIKMPRKDGRELYGDLKKNGLLPPTIVFFDVVSADEVIEIRRLGNPAFVEKGSAASALPEMAALIQKIAYFG